MIKIWHPNPKVVGVIDNMLWAAELDDDDMMQQIYGRLHHIYVYINNSKLEGQPLFNKYTVNQVVDLLANEVGRKIAMGEIE
jgi:hypothetical protein